MIITKVEGRDIFGYRQFSQEFLRESLILIHGRNGSGKSSFLDALCWGLYGKLPREGVSQEEVIRRGASQCSVTVTFDDGSSIMRTRGKETVLTLFGISHEEAATTQAKQRVIDRLIGDYKTFTSSCYMMAGHLSLADASMTPAKRSQLIRRLLGLEQLEEARKAAALGAKEAAAAVARIESGLKADAEFLQGQQLLSPEELEEARRELDVIRSTLDRADAASEKIRKHAQLRSDIVTLAHSLSLLSSVPAAAQFDEEGERKRIEARWQQDRDAILRDMAPLKERVANETALRLAVDAESARLTGLSTAIQQKQAALAGVPMLRQRQAESRKELAEIDRADKNSLQCPVCSSKLLQNSDRSLHPVNEETVNRRRAELLEEAAQLQQQLDGFTAIEVEVSKTKQELEGVSFSLRAHEGALAECQSAKAALERLATSGRQAKTRYETDLADIDRRKQKFAEEDAQRRADILSKQAAAKERMDAMTVEEIESRPTEEEIALAGSKPTIAVRFSEMQARITNAEALEKFQAEVGSRIAVGQAQLAQEVKKHERYVFWQQQFPLLEKRLFSTALPAIEDGTNRWLEQLGGNISVAFLLGKVGIELSVFVDGEEWQYVQRGRGERARIAVATTLATLDVVQQTHQSPLNMLLVDETLDFMDVEGIEALVRLVRERSGVKIIVSHREELKGYEEFESVLLADRSTGFSVIASDRACEFAN